MSLREGAPNNLGRPEFLIPIGTEFDFGGVEERIVTRDDFSLERARKTPGLQPIAILGYGVQGPAQALNLRDNGFEVFVGQRESYATAKDKGSTNWEKAIIDGWLPGKNLFSDLTEAVRRGTQIQYLLSDAGQREQWSNILPLLTPDKTLYFSHGFSIAYQKQTGVVPPKNIDVIMVAPKGAGRSVRELFLSGRGINSSFAVFQDASGRALEKVLATGMAIGSGFLFPTTFELEAFSDNYGERGGLCGGIKGFLDGAYFNLRQNGLSPEQAALHTIEITTQTISKIIGEKGADGLIKDLPKNLLSFFSKGFRAAFSSTTPVFEDLYEKVATGAEAKRVLEINSLPNYRDILDGELGQIKDSEFAKVAAEIRNKRGGTSLVPSKIENTYDAILAGVLVGLMQAQYELLRKKGHKPSEAFNETVEEATQSLYPLIDRIGDDGGIDGMYKHCSTTAQRGALDWNGAFRNVLQPVFRDLYRMKEPSLDQGAIERILSSEMWSAGKQVRSLRPENQKIA